MSLPKIMHPQFEILIPSMNKKVKFRQFLVREEKILLVAKTSEDETDILTAVKQIVQNCSLDESFDVDKLTIFDLEYVFLKIRALSVNNVVTLSYRDFEDNKLYDFDVNLDDVAINIPENIDNKIPVTAEIGIIMTYPSAALYSDKKFLNSTREDATIDLVIRCIDKVYDQDGIYDAKTFSYDELLQFVDDLDVKSFEKMNNFLINAPRMEYTIRYKNSLGNDRSILLNTLTDFFTLR
jgi:T4 bacteriophage base plate protein